MDEQRREEQRQEVRGECRQQGARRMEPSIAAVASRLPRTLAAFRGRERAFIEATAARS